MWATYHYIQPLWVNALLLRGGRAHPSRRQGEAEGCVVGLEGRETAAAIGIVARRRWERWRPNCRHWHGRRPTGGGSEQERRSATADELDELAPGERGRRGARKRLAVVRCWRL